MAHRNDLAALLRARVVPMFPPQSLPSWHSQFLERVFLHLLTSVSATALCHHSPSLRQLLEAWLILISKWRSYSVYIIASRMTEMGMESFPYVVQKLQMQVLLPVLVFLSSSLQIKKINKLKCHVCAKIYTNEHIC